MEAQNGNPRMPMAEKHNFTEVYEEVTTHEEDTKCGIGTFHPRWLQILASKKIFVIVYALAGMQQLAISAYSIGTMSTIEKNYKMSSRQSGIIAASWDIGGLIANIAITYIAAKGHRTRWVAMGVLVVGLSSLLRVLPYHIFGPGETAKMYTKQYGNWSNETSETWSANGQIIPGIKKLSTNVNCSLENENSGTITFYILVTSQLVLGVGTAVYWTCGATYLDDNVRKNLVPALLSIIQVIRLFGPTVGFLLSSYALQFYVNPYLSPFITKADPRWVGAWWLGWYPIAVCCFIFAALLMFFPRSLPRAIARRKDSQVACHKENTPSLEDFKDSIRRILANKVVVYNTLSSVFFTLGLMAYWTFMPKYLESQFRMSASTSNIITGNISIMSHALGILLSGIIISKYKPQPRFLAGWTVLVEFLQVFSYVSYIFLSCEEQKYHGHWESGHSWNLTETCNMKFSCGNDIQFAPVCDKSTGLAFYSPCHAGCNITITSNNTVEYGGCACVEGAGIVMEGLCPTDCSFNILIFVLIMAIMSFTIATGRTANTILQFRCIDDEDKSLSIGVTETVISFLGLMPAPLIYGVIMDWACIVWGDDCGKRGNCWLYDGPRLRFVFNITAAGFLLAGTLLDAVVWYYSKGMKIYDEDFEKEAVNKKSKELFSSDTKKTLLN